MNTKYWGNYTPAFRLEFDSVERTGVIVREFVPVPKPSTRMDKPILPNETKDEYAKRLEDANKN